MTYRGDIDPENGCPGCYRAVKEIGMLNAEIERLRGIIRQNCNLDVVEIAERGPNEQTEPQRPKDPESDWVWRSVTDQLIEQEQGRVCPHCNLKTDWPEGSRLCPIYWGGDTGGHCPIFVDGRTREQERELGRSRVDEQNAPRNINEIIDDLPADRQAKVAGRVAELKGDEQSTLADRIRETHDQLMMVTVPIKGDEQLPDPCPVCDGIEHKPNCDILKGD